MGAERFKARLIREGIAQSYIQLINDLMQHAFGKEPDRSDPNYQKFVVVLNRVERMIAILERIERSIDPIRDRAPLHEKRINDLREKGNRMRMAIIESSEKVILSLSMRISRQIPGKAEKSVR